MDLEALRALSRVLLWISVVLPIVAALAVGGRYYVEVRIGRLIAEVTRREISALQAELGERKAEIEDLQTRTAARRLTNSHRETMLPILRKAAGPKAMIACKMLDGESCDYAEQLAQVLRTANWKTEPTNRSSLADLPRVVAIYRPFGQWPRGAKELEEALRAAGVPHLVGMADEESTKRFGGDKIFIVVGRKG